MLSPEYYEKLDPSYREILLKLETDVKKSLWFSDRNALMEFIGKYMIPHELWNLTPKNLLRFDNNDLAYHFLPFGNDRVAYDSKYYDKQMTLRVFFNTKEMLFPYKYLNKGMEVYEKQINSFIPRDIRQRHEEMKILYLKIKEAEGDIDEWFAALMEANDHEFVKDNVEYRLGTDLTDKKLWKKYINYLKKHDFKLLLETYSKYVRFFIDDTEMMQEYRQAAVKYGDYVAVPWKNPFSIEVYNKEFWNSGVKNSVEQHLNISSENEPLTVRFNSINPARPDFPFLSLTIRYILDNANPELLQKFFKTCKWFYAAKPVNVCYKYEEINSLENQPVEFKEQSIKSFNNSFLDTIIAKLFISTVFKYTNEDRQAISNLIPKIYRCSAKYVDIHNQNLSLKELKFFIGNAADLELSNVRDSDGKDFSPESILQLTLKIKNLRLLTVECSAETAPKLSELEFDSKLDYIYLSGFKLNLLDPTKFAEFVTKSCSAKATIIVYVRRNERNEEYANRFRRVLGDAINEKWIGHKKPYFFIL